MYTEYNDWIFQLKNQSEISRKTVGKYYPKPKSDTQNPNL